MLAGIAFCFLSLFMYFLAFSRVSHSKNGVIMFVISLKVDLIMNSSQSKSNKDLYSNMKINVYKYQFKSKRLIGLGKYDISPSFLIFWTQSRVSKHNPQNIKNKNVAFSSPNIEIYDSLNKIPYRCSYNTNSEEHETKFNFQSRI